MTDEHVVGRKFVPTGSFATGWSLITRACERCNNEKSDLEDEISAVILLPDLGNLYDTPGLVEIARRKVTKSRSRRTKKPIADSYEEQSVSFTLMSSAQLCFNLIGPPQVDVDRIQRLAWFHLQGFFCLITYDSAKNKEAFFLHVSGSMERGAPTGATLFNAASLNRRKIGIHASKARGPMGTSKSQSAEIPLVLRSGRLPWNGIVASGALASSAIFRSFKDILISYIV